MKAKDNGKIRVLVYGTLKRDHSNHDLMEAAGAEFLGYDSVTGPYTVYDLGGLPAAVDSKLEKPRRVRGEMYTITPEGLASLDMMEGHPNLYRRRKLFTDVMQKRVWVYFLHATQHLHEDVNEAVSGLWRPSKEESRYWYANAKEAV